MKNKFEIKIEKKGKKVDKKRLYCTLMSNMNILVYGRLVLGSSKNDQLLTRMSNVTRTRKHSKSQENVKDEKGWYYKTS